MSKADYVNHPSLDRQLTLSHITEISIKCTLSLKRSFEQNQKVLKNDYYIYLYSMEVKSIPTPR